MKIKFTLIKIKEEILSLVNNFIINTAQVIIYFNFININ